MELQVVEYINQHDTIWDDFVLNNSANGTIFHTRKFLSYHSKDKFIDRSILIYHNNILVCTIAVCETENSFFSHKGTSGGGPVIHKNYFTSKYICEISQLINTHYNRKLEMLLPEEVFSCQITKPLIFFLSQNKRLEPNMSAYFDLSEKSTIKSKRLITGVRSTEKSDIKFEVSSADNDYHEFYTVLCENLNRYNASPTHSLEEFIALKKALNTSQFLYLAKRGNEILAGLWILKATHFAWHTQYIAKNYTHKEQYVLSTLIHKAKQLAESKQIKILSLGSCDGGADATFSRSLCNFKEKLGAKFCFRYKISNQ